MLEYVSKESPQPGDESYRSELGKCGGSSVGNLSTTGALSMGAREFYSGRRVTNKRRLRKQINLGSVELNATLDCCELAD